MKGIINLIIAGVFVLATTTSMAATKTGLDLNWICTTNASSSDLKAEQAADTKMGKTEKSASGAFAVALKHCRDCTKITCKAQSH